MNETIYDLYLAILTKDNIKAIILQNYNAIKIIEIYNLFGIRIQITDESTYIIKNNYIKYIDTNEINTKDTDD